MSIVIGIVDKISRIAKFTSTTKKGNTLFLHAQEGMDYVVVDKQTGFAPKKIIAIRDGNNLKLFVEGESDPSVIIEDYYLYPAQVIGQTADGSVHNYVPLSASEQEQVGSLEDHQAAVQVLSSEQQAPITWETNDTDWGLITLIAYGLTVAGAMALMITHGGGGDDKKEVTVVNTKALIDDVQDSQEPQTGSVKRGESTNDETPTLLGHLNKSLASGESVIIYRDGVKIGTAKTNGKDWTFEDVTGGLITDRTYTYTARVEHSDGTKGATSDGYDIIFDNSAPTQGVTITDVADDVAPVTGSVANNGYTNDTDPVITGTLTHATEKGEYVVVLRNGVAVGKALVTGTTWTFADTGLADGETYVYTALVKDAAGNTGAISKGYTIHIDTTAPDHLVSIDGVYDDVAPGIGIIGNNGVTNDTTPELRGQIDKALADNETLVIYRDGKKIGDAVVEGTSWHYTDSGLANNTQYKYTAQVEDLAGNTGPGSNDYSININFTGPSQLVAITAVTDDVDPVTGNVAHKGHTNDTKPDVSGTLSAALNNGEVVVVYRDGIKAGEATVTGNTWTYHENLALSDGKHTYTAYVEDAAHNLGAASNSYEITVDTVAPDQTITLTEITDNKDPVTGKIPQGGETNDDTPTLHGKLSSELSAGEVVVIYRNGTKVGIADTDGTQWSFEDAGLASGSKYNYYAQVEDLAGNISQPSNDYNITLNTNGASQSTHILSIMDDQDPVTGNVLNGGYTNDITPTLTGSVTAELSGSEKLIIYRNGTEAGQAIVKGTSWTFTDTLDNSDGHYIYTAAVKDAAGNQGAMSNDYSINVDVTAPTQTAVITHIIDDEGAWQGNVAKDGITDDKTPTVVGTLDAALDKTEMLAVYRNGKLVGTAVVHNKEWAFTDSLANDGSYVYTARVVDKAGNEGHLSGEFGITVDTGFPSQQVTITDIQDDKAPQTGSVANHGFTNDDTPTLHGKLTGELLTGQNVVIFRNGVEVNKAVVNGTDWTFSDSGLTDGNTYLYTAVVRNAAGNTGNISDGYTITMDTSAPNQSVQITTIMDDVAPLIGEVKNGGYTNDTTPQLQGTLSAALGSGEYVVMMRDGVMIGKAQVTGTGWTYDDANLTDGTTYIYTALVRDAAGNSGAVSGNYTINIDTTAPDALVTINTVYDDKEPGIGEIGKGDTTNDTTLELRGDLSKTLAANETLVIYRDGHKVGTADVDGTHWTYTDSGLANNSHYTYTARVEDAAGNLGKDSDKYDIHVKFDGPSQTVAITGVNDDVTPVTGNVAHKGHTNDARPDVTGTLNEAIGAGDVVAVYRDKVKVGVAIVTGTTWTFSESLDLADGKHVYTAYVEDAAHNLGAASNSYEINVDTVAPDQTVTLTEILDNKDPVTGPVQNGGYTNDDTPTLHGTLSSGLTSGEVLVIYRNGVKIGKGVISQDGLGWSYEDSGLASGSDYRYYAQVEDLAGNVSDKSNEHAIKLNTDGASQGTQILNILDDQDPVQGSVASGGHTNDTTPTLTGSVSAALAGTEEVIIFRNGAEVGKATVTGTAWTYTDKVITTDGEYTYTAAVRDATGNQGAESNAYLINLDTTAPSQHVVIEGITDDMEPSVGEIANNGVTNDKTPTLHGQLDGALSATESVHVYRDGKLAGTAKVTGKTWVYTDNLASDGHYEYTAKVVDKAGNEGAVSDKYAMTLDTTAPTQVVTITEIMDDKAPQTGKVDNGGFTNDDTPTLNGKLSAALAAGETVSVYRDNVKIGTATVAEDGLGWSYTDKELKDATTYVYTAYAEDAAGNLGPVSDKYTITTDMTAPTQSVQITTIMDDVAPLIGEVKNGGYTNDTTPQLQGTLSAALGSGEYVVMMRDGVMIGKAQVTGTGWTYDDANLTDGTTYIYTALVRDAAGNSGAVSGNYTINIDTTAPDALVTINTVYDDKEPGIGEIGKGDTTNDTTLELRGDLSKTLAANETLVIYRDGHKVGTADVDGTHWSYTDSGLANNSHYTYTARVEDAAGNLGKDSAAYDIHVKFDGPSQTVAITGVNDDVAPVTGNVAHKGHTNDARPDVTGTLNEAIGAGDVVAVYRDKVKVGVAKVTGTTWTFSESLDLADGKHVYTAYVEDAAHNLGAASNSYEINVDTVAPDQTVTLTEILDNKDPVTGPVQNGGYTNDDTPTLHGTLSSALTSGEVLVIYRNGVKIGKGVISQDGLGWSYEDSGLASGSDYRYYAQVEDLAGNVSDKSNEHAIKLNTDGASQGTQILNILDDQDPVQGSVASGGHTNDTTPTLTGSVSAALAGTEEVIIFRNGAEVGKATVTGTAWSYTDKAITTDGEYTYTAAVRDATGNQGAESNAYLINLDTTAPSQHVVIEGITDDMEPSVGEIANNGVTNDKTPTLHGQLDGTLSATESVHVYRDGKLAGTAKVTGKTWVYTDNLASDGHYEYTAKVVDKAGNEGAVSDKYAMTLDTTAPTQVVTITEIMDDKAPQTGKVDNGGFTNDDTPTLNGKLSAALAAGETVSVYRDNVKIGTATVAEDGLGWSYTDKELKDATTYVYTAYAEDAAGNLGPVSDKYTITTDMTAPTQSVQITTIMDDVAPLIGEVKNGGYTNDTTPQLQGTLSAALGSGEYVVVMRDGVMIGKAQVTGTGWTYDDANLTDGTTYIYTALVRDAAGNSGAVSGNYTINIDTTAPDALVTINTVYDDKEPGIGEIGKGDTTNDTTLELRGDLSKTLAANETLVIYRDGHKVGTADVDGTHWSYTDSGLANNSHYTYTARVEDAAGNLGKDSAAYDIHVKFDGPSQTVAITGVNDDVALVTGNVAHKGHTNDARPDVTGTLNEAIGAGDVVAVYRDKVKVGVAKVTGTTWTFSESADLADGKHVYTAYVEDAAHNLGAASNSYEINVDTVAPDQTVTLTEILDNKDPVTGPVQNGGYTNDDTPTLHGTLSSALTSGEVLVIYRNGVKIGKGVISQDGLGWSYEDSGLASGSDYRYYAQVEDLAGNVSDKSNEHAIKLNTDGASQGTQILNITDDQDPVQGSVASGGHTNDTTPTLTGSVSAALAGTEEVIIFRNGAEVGKATVTGTAWTYTDKVITTDGEYTYTAAVRDATGNQGAESNAYLINLDTTAPSQHVVIEGITDDMAPSVGEIANGGVTNDKTPTLHGSLDNELSATELVKIYRDGNFVGTAKVTGKSWSYNDKLNNDGTYVYTAKVVDKAGNEGVVSDKYGITLDTVLPTQLVTITDIQDDKAPQLGSVKNGGFTNDDTPTLHGTLNSKLGAGETVSIYRGDSKVGTATVAADGLNWSYTDKGLTDGTTYIYTAYAEDAAGNLGKVSDKYTITMDTTPPAQLVAITDIIDDKDPQTGSVKNGGFTNDDTPTLHGTLNSKLGAGETVSIYRGDSKVGTATVAADGLSWSYTDNGLTDGTTYIYTAYAEDAAGNLGKVSDKYTITMDTTPPAQLVTITDIIDDKDPQTGSVKNGGFTNDDTPTLHGTLNSKLGAGETVSIYRGDSKVGTATVAKDGLSWSYTDNGLTDGTTYIYTAYAEDAAGNLGKVSDKYTITMDSTPPGQLVTITDIIDDKDPQTGSVKNGGFTNDDTPTLHGTLNSKLGAGETVSIYRGDSKVGTATVAKDGLSWSYTDNGLTDGSTYVYTAYAEDAAGNLGKVSDKYTITMDSTPPGQLVTITDIIDDKDPQTGSVKNGGFTNDDTPTLHGTLNSKLGAGETVSIYRGDSKVGTATVAKDGLSWSYTDNGLTDGTTYIYTAYAEDAAGNLGKVSDKYTITMDSTPPGQLVTITDIIDDKDPQTGSVKNGGFTNDDTPTLHGTLNSKLGAGETVSIYRGDSKAGTATVAEDGLSWSYTDNGLTDGTTYIYTAYAEDAAGNLGKVSDNYTITMDTTPPGQLVTITDIIDDKDPQTGSVKNGGFTNDDTPTLHGTLNSKLGAGETVSIYRGDSKVGTATVAKDGLSWSYTDNGLTDGTTYVYTAYAEDAAGNLGKVSDKYTITMDTTSPTQTVTITEVMDDVKPLTGKVDNNGYTDDKTPTLNGTVSQALSNTEMVAVFRDGVFLDYAKVIGTTWTFTDALTNDGKYSYIALVVDKAGNTGAESGKYVINVDTTVPDQTVKIISVLDDVKPFEGNIAKGGYTNDTTPELHGTVSAALKANQVLVLYLNDVKVGTMTVNNDLTWQYTGLLTNDGHYNWKAVVETLAGVPGVSDEYDINLDTSIPEALATIAGYNDHVGNEQGPFGNGTTTDDRNPELFGKVSKELKERESVLVYDTTKGAVGSGKEVLMGTATMDADKNWSFFVPEAHRLVNGSSPKFEAVVTNGAGLGKHSDDFTLNVDLEIKVNEVNTLDTHPIISGSVGFQIYDDEHLEVTINGKTYSSLDGAVVVDPLNNTWYVKLPVNSGLSVNKSYDVVAKLLNSDNSIVVQDKTLNEIHIAKEPEAPTIPPSNDAANKATGMTIGENGAWRIFSNMNVLDQNGTDITNTSSFKTNTLNSNGKKGVYGSMSFVDFDRDGYMDIVGLDSEYSDGQQIFRYMPGQYNISSTENNAVNSEYYATTMGDSSKRDGVDPKYSGSGSTSANVFSWWGGTALYDKTGDGYVDILYGDRTPDDANAGGGYNTQLIWNNNGQFQKDAAYVSGTENGVKNDPNFIKYGQSGQSTPDKVVSSVDLNNDGCVDLVHGGEDKATPTYLTDDPSVKSKQNGRLVVLSNKGDGGFSVKQILTGIDDPNTGKTGVVGELNSSSFNGQSMVWADFNGDGWLDMFVGSAGVEEGKLNMNSVILFNDGKGNLAQDTAIGSLGQAKGAFNFKDQGDVGGALSVDWNMDGKTDVVTIPRLAGNGRPIKPTQEVALHLNKSTGQTTLFDKTVLQSSDAGSGASSKGNGYTGLLNIDIDWDGRQDLLVFTGTEGATFIKNTNKLKEGTAMHIKILDHEGINAFFGNTVKLYDSNGNLVATQVINHQAGNQTSNSTGLLSFYGLKADETYNAVLLRNVNGVQQNIGAESHVGDFSIANVNASWGGLTTGKNWDSYVLTAESGNSASNANIGNGVVGTGYNDTFFATLGENAYEGGGGSYLVNGARQWSDKGGIDIVDFKLAGKTNITVDLRETDYQNTGYGNQKFSNIEGVRGGEGDDTFYSNSSDNFFDGGAGNNTFHLGAGGQDTIMYRLLADNDTGGHGVDQINKFWVGTVEATANADIVNIGDLLVGYKGGSFDNVAKYVNGKAVITDATITDYLKLENGSLLLDRDGKGGEYNSVKIADLHFDNVDADKVDLAMLLANHQIVF